MFLLRSLLFHVFIVITVTIGFWFKPDPIEIKESPIMIEFISEKSKKTKDNKKTVVEDLPPPIEDKPQPAAKALEKPIPPTKAELAPKSVTKPIEKIKPKPTKQPTAKPKPPQKVEKPIEKVEEKAEEDKRAEFTSILKNLADTMPVDTTKDGPKLTQSPVIDRVSAGELGAFQKQIQGCWNLLPGAANADAIAVNLTINVNRDRTVRDVTITDQTRYQIDAVFRAAADNAMRALRHPDCTPLDLPINKYDQWKSITLNFDPKGMF
jgi:hypothetical protein